MSGIAEHLDDLRIALSEVDVLSMLTEATYDEADWTDPEPEVVDAVATLLGLIKKSASGALAAFLRLHGAVADAQPAPAGSGEAFDYSDGTAPGGEKPLPRQDAEIVRRLRTLSQDGRFDGYTDDALIHLFRRNQQAVGGTEEQIMDVMTRPAADEQTDKSTPSGEGMSAEDAAIVRRIRTRCPDRRFDGGSDAELLDLFKRNKRTLDVVGRCSASGAVTSTSTRPPWAARWSRWRWSWCARQAAAAIPRDHGLVRRVARYAYRRLRIELVLIPEREAFKRLGREVPFPFRIDIVVRFARRDVVRVVVHVALQAEGHQPAHHESLRSAPGCLITPMLPLVNRSPALCASAIRCATSARRPRTSPTRWAQ